MATYKVPQDVEAEDKLLGPFSFRQFIYLIIAAAAGLIAWGLSRIFIGLVVIPIPVVIFFLILALPLKKDQPMETYLAAVVRFWLKPRTRLWEPEGNIVNVEITAPRIQQDVLTKGYGGSEAAQQLAYYSQVVDTQGWSTRGVTSAFGTTALNDTVVAEAQSAEDILDDTGNLAQNFNSMITESDEARRQAMIQSMQQSLHTATTTPEAVQTPAPAMPATPPAAEPGVSPAYNPYPSSIHQKVISPPGDQPAAAPQPQPQPEPVAPKPTEQAQASSETTISPDIMRLATSKDLSISTIAREAERIQARDRLADDEEVVVSLR